STNPFGIIFNPVSIEKIISKSLNLEFYTEKDIFFHNERWHCFDVHSDLSNTNKEELLNDSNQLLQSTNQKLREATHIIITYGTSWVYRNLETNQVVANCHKVPQAAFSKEILSAETIEKSIQNTIDLIEKVNPKANFIFTVSPVRHLKDGFVENQLSKAHLITAIQQTINNKQQTTNYFPSYEIMMDELRDYRFYNEDMLHPSQVAIDYIWERFSETTISSDSHSIMEEVCSIQKGLQHRSFNPKSESHQQFLSKLQDKMMKLQKRFPQIQF
ncbi:MAG: GSCFA domain-containing protein, partial [Flavobacterium sp.]|uniref:GSCFA domain-containing protein n=1 Tax=Flavobacterium sp. TaxID=239 RepID=UPI00262D63F1